MSISNYLEEKILNLTFRTTAYAGISTVWVKLHTGDPGEDCTANAATETTRHSTTFNAASNPAGTITNAADINWTSVSTTEVITFVSLWDASSAGNAYWSGALTASASLTAGGNFTIAAGNLTITLA